MASRSWNKVELMGNLTRDPELRYTPNGAAVCSFGIATNRTYVVDGEKREDVDFHKIVAWNKLGELCNQLLKKGSKVFVSGRLQYREWEAQDGQKRRDSEIVIDDMIVLTSRGAPGAGTGDDDFTSQDPAGAPASRVAAKPAPAAAADEKVAPSDDELAAAFSDDTTEAPKEEEAKPAPKAEEKVEDSDDLPF